MAVQANKWVVAAIEAIKWSELTDVNESAEVARLCDFFGFNVAYLWIKENSQSYRLGLREGFATNTPLREDDVEHATMHIAVVLSTRGSELMQGADTRITGRIHAIVAEKLASPGAASQSPVQVSYHAAR